MADPGTRLLQLGRAQNTQACSSNREQERPPVVCVVGGERSHRWGSPEPVPPAHYLPQQVLASAAREETWPGPGAEFCLPT